MGMNILCFQGMSNSRRRWGNGGLGGFPLCCVGVTLPGFLQLSSLCIPNPAVCPVHPAMVEQVRRWLLPKRPSSPGCGSSLSIPGSSEQPEGMRNVLQVPRLEQCPAGNEGSVVGSKASRCRKAVYFPPKEGRDRRGEWQKIGTISR